MGRAVSACALVWIVMLAVACGGATPADPGPPDGAGSETGASTTRNPLPPGLLVVVPLTDPGMGGPEDQTDVLVFSPETGELIDERSIPGVFLGGAEGLQMPVIGRRNFSDDGRFLAWTADCALHVAELNANVYQQVASVTPPQSFSQSKACFDRPQFVAGGTTVHVRLLAHDPANAIAHDGVGPAPLRLMSVDAQAPDAAPQEVEKLRKRDAERVTFVDVVDHHDGVDEGPPQAACDPYTGRECSALTATPTEITRLTLVFSDSAESFASFETATYDCDEPVDDHTVLCTHHQGPALVGSAAFADVDRASETVELREAAPETPERVQRAVVSPDSETLLIVTDSGWFRTGTSGSGEPKLLFDGLVDPKERINGLAAGPYRVEWIDG